MSSIAASIARLHIVAIGALGALTFGVAFTGEYLPHVAALVAVDWFVVNLLNRVVDAREDRHNGVPGAETVARHARLTVAAGVSVLACSFALTAVLWPTALWPRLAFHALGFAYNWRLIPSPRGRRRLKELPVVKNVASATGFLLTCFALPLTQAAPLPTITSLTIGVAALFFFFFELSYEVLYDLRDIEGDRVAGVLTWPVLLGARGGARVAIAEMVIALVVIVVGYASGALPWHIAIMGAAPAIQLAIVWPRLPDRISSRLCIELTWLGALLLAGYHVWEALALPGSTRA